MFWETVAALLLMIGTLPWWILAAVAWGAIKAAIAFFGAVIVLLAGSTNGLEDAWFPLVLGFSEGVSAAWSIPSWMWTWAKFEHPLWAALIGFLFLLFLR